MRAFRSRWATRAGYWDGDTLVVETRNFLRGTGFLGGQTGPHFRLEERFTRVGPETLLYEATVDDPTVWTTPWTFQLIMNRNDYPVYEYACHEGNLRDLQHPHRRSARPRPRWKPRRRTSSRLAGRAGQTPANQWNP